MKRICEFCKKEYDWVEGQPKWVKPNSDMKPTNTNAIPSKRFCCYECGVKYRRDKIEKTNLEKYGFKCASQNKEVYEKSRKTCLKKYGVENPLKSKKIRLKCK